MDEIVNGSVKEVMQGLLGRDARRVHSVAYLDMSAAAQSGKQGPGTQYMAPSSYTRAVTGTKVADYRRNRFSTKPWIPVGLDNNYPFFLNSLPERSHTHKRALSSSVTHALGESLVVDSQDEDFITGYKAWLKTIGFTRKMIREILRQTGNQGGIFVSFNFAKRAKTLSEMTTWQTGQFKYVLKLQAGSCVQRRLGKLVDDVTSERYGEITHHWDNPKMWENDPRKTPTDWKGIPVYSIGVIDDLENPEYACVSEDLKKAFYEKEIPVREFSHLIARDGSLIEPWPKALYESNGYLNAVLLEEALSFMSLAKVQNGLATDYIVTAALKDTRVKSPGIDESDTAAAKRNEAYYVRRDALTYKVQQELFGDENTGNAMILFRDPGDVADPITITPIPHNDTRDMHEVLDSRKQVTILTGWAVTNENLLGIPNIVGKGESNQADALETASDLWYSSLIYPELVQPLEEFESDILRPLYLKLFNLEEPDDLQVYLKRKKIFRSKPSDPVLKEYFGMDEVRSIYGYPPVTDDVRQELIERKRLEKSTMRTVTNRSET